MASLDSVEKVARLIYSTGPFVFQKSGRGVMCHVSCHACHLSVVIVMVMKEHILMNE